MKIKEIKKLFFSQTLSYLDVYLLQQIGRSMETIDSYKDALTVFKQYVIDELHASVLTFYFKDCTRVCIFNFLNFLKVRGNQPGTRNQRLATIKSYLKYVSQIDVSLLSVYIEVKSIPACKNPEKEKKVLPELALNAIFAEPKNNKMGLRDRTLMIMLYDTGTRISELLNLKLPDIYLKKSDSYILVTGKGSKERPLYLSGKTVEHLKLYISVFHNNDEASEQYLFYTVIKGKTDRMSVGNAERLIKQYAKTAKQKCPEVPDNVHPHDFRRTLATNLYQEGASLALISSVLGHCNIETTRIYAKPSKNMLKNAITSIQPAFDEPIGKKWKNQEMDLKRFTGLR